MTIEITKKNAKQAAFLKRAFEQKQLAQSYLFVATDVQEALNTAYWLACLYNCTGADRPDGTCRICQQIISGNHPDVLEITRGDKQTIGIDQVRVLKSELAKSPVQSDCRFFFIKEAQKLTLPSSNALLNLLEEPVAPVVTILITNNADKILPTVRSRTQIINFAGEVLADSRTKFLMQAGFSSADLAELGDTQALDQSIKYFYQELSEKNALAVVSAHKLGELAKKKITQNYIINMLKLLAQQDLTHKQQAGAKILKNLLKIDRMQHSNVSFRNLLTYLALQ
ncbi:DNA polymerase III subunit delta [Lactobacillus sp. ESL0684]|uniref:DNA polymerase III subunit delta n=1 Tax=unclassified Lactobacillus TaxID=2620435 RepID=UPI0023F81CFC|nr:MULTISPECIES: DNA polymerase III subunit delta [unclassified Lactobacillus]WEV41018.1 DNA polymerase III subunit delta [Lactobacillus sp. ESL0681]WEV44151.1 DNA polymerase III subunit delta [Lactobacillus sp. ESL0684]